MSKPVTMWRSDDDELWNTEAKARDRDALLAAIADAMAPLGPIPDDPKCLFSNGHRYVRRRPENVLEVRRRLLTVTRKAVPEWTPMVAGYEAVMSIDANLRFAGMAYYRNLWPLYEAWARLSHIDSEWREWGQTNYAREPFYWEDAEEIMP